MQYLVLRAESASELTVQVNRLLKLGWEPLGGVSYSTPQDMLRNEDTGEVFCQALIRREGDFPDESVLPAGEIIRSAAEDKGVRATLT